MMLGHLFRSYGPLWVAASLLILADDEARVTAWGTNFLNSVQDRSIDSASCLSLSRRSAIAGAAAVLLPVIARADDTVIYRYENRDRQSNKNALIRDDYWFMMGKSPPRLLNGPIRQDDPQWNAFGSCQTTEGDGASSNSCTYVSLKQRIPTYSKYGFAIALGAKEYSLLGKALQNAAVGSNSSPPSTADRYWNEAASYVLPATQPSAPPPVVDALLKMVLFASGMLTSPNYSGPNKQLLVARFYANEVGFATKELQDAIEVRDGPRALAAWEFGKDSWNSFFQVVNGSVSAKVGEKFEQIS
jgi:hypothetical protein